VKMSAIRTRFLKELPHLTEFLTNQGAEIFCIRLKSIQLLDGVKDIFVETIE
jgi:hypothetical protein